MQSVKNVLRAEHSLRQGQTNDLDPGRTDLITFLNDNAARTVVAQHWRIVGKPAFWVNHDPRRIRPATEPHSQARAVMQGSSDTDNNPVDKRPHAVQMRQTVRSRYIARIA